MSLSPLLPLSIAIVSEGLHHPHRMHRLKSAVCTILLCGSSNDILNEIDRNLADAMETPYSAHASFLAGAFRLTVVRAISGGAKAAGGQDKG